MLTLLLCSNFRLIFILFFIDVQYSFLSDFYGYLFHKNNLPTIAFFDNHTFPFLLIYSFNNKINSTNILLLLLQNE